MNHPNSSSIRLIRDVDAYMVPSGDKIKLIEGNLVRITQALGGNYTVIVNGNMVQISAENADALGIELSEEIAATPTPTTFKSFASRTILSRTAFTYGQ